jgi:hypothetical protein
MPCPSQPLKRIEEVTRDPADKSHDPSIFFTSKNEIRPRKKRKHLLRPICLVISCFLPQAHAHTPPSSIDVPKRNVVLMLKAQGKGVQIYACVEGNWTLIGPDARLLNERGDVIGRHYAGPTWQLTDGSLVMGKTIANAASSNAESVPWLLLEAFSGTGEFKAVKFIQRRDTQGGVAPSTPCKGTAELWVPYTANYLFYVTRQ